MIVMIPVVFIKPPGSAFQNIKTELCFDSRQIVFNLTGKTWPKENGQVVSYAEHMVERFTSGGPDPVNYQATVYDPLMYTRPWTFAAARK